MKRILTVLLLSVSGLALAGCGGNGSSSSAVAASCRDSIGLSCTDYSATASQLQASCANNGGSYMPSACSRSSSVGGCRVTVGTAWATVWYYPPSLAEADVRRACPMANGSYISP